MDIIQMKPQSKLVTTVTPDVLLVMILLITIAQSVMMDITIITTLVYLALNVNNTKVTIVMLNSILVLLAPMLVSLVLDLLITVPNVKPQEKDFQTVTVQMVSSIMEIPVLVVLITVPPVPLELIVPLALISEKVLHIVNVQPDIMMLVKLLVNFVTGLVSLVLVLTLVLNVIIPNKDLSHIVNVTKDGRTPKTVLWVVKKWITQKESMI
jgi:hypothetical protein